MSSEGAPKIPVGDLEKDFELPQGINSIPESVVKSAEGSEAKADDIPTPSQSIRSLIEGAGGLLGVPTDNIKESRETKKGSSKAGKTKKVKVSISDKKEPETPMEVVKSSEEVPVLDKKESDSDKSEDVPSPLPEAINSDKDMKSVEKAESLSAEEILRRRDSHRSTKKEVSGGNKTNEVSDEAELEAVRKELGLGEKHSEGETDSLEEISGKSGEKKVEESLGSGSEKVTQIEEVVGNKPAGGVFSRIWDKNGGIRGFAMQIMGMRLPRNEKGEVDFSKEKISKENGVDTGTQEASPKKEVAPDKKTTEEIKSESVGSGQKEVKTKESSETRGEVNLNNYPGLRIDTYGWLREKIPFAWAQRIIDKTEAKNVGKDVFNISETLATLKGDKEKCVKEADLASEQISALAKQIEGIKNDGTEDSSKKNKAIRILEKKHEKLLNNRDAMVSKAAMLQGQSELWHKELTFKEQKRDEAVKRFEIFTENKIAPLEERQKNLEHESDKIEVEVKNHEDNIKKCNDQIGKLPKGSSRTLKALQKKIKNSEAYLAVAREKWDKINARLVPLGGKISEYRTSIDQLKNINREDLQVDHSTEGDRLDEKGDYEKFGEAVTEYGTGEEESEVPEKEAETEETEVEKAPESKKVESKEKEKNMKEVVLPAGDFIDKWNYFVSKGGFASPKDYIFNVEKRKSVGNLRRSIGYSEFDSIIRKVFPDKPASLNPMRAKFWNSKYEK